MPKQFAPLLGPQTLFYGAAERNLADADELVVVTNADQWFLAAAELELLPAKLKLAKTSFVIEPVGRNTAPAVALACLGLAPDETVVVAPSDHLVRDGAAYRERIEAAAALAAEGYLVTFGIRPNYPETGYGYIQADPARPLSRPESYAVAAFKEKPDAATAARYVASGSYLWNSGMFVFKAGAFLEELRAARAELYEAARAAYAGAERAADPKSGAAMVRIAEPAMKAIPADSVDYAVMEKSARVAVVAAEFGWSDVGSWDALYDVAPKDAAGNAALAPLSAVNSTGNLVVASRRVALVGLKDHIVVETPDAVLVAKRGASQDVKAAVEALKAGSSAERELTHAHLTVRRPWGSYTILDEAPGFKVKRIVVTPGSKLSLQKHARRAERWVVAGGSPVVTIDAERRAYALGEVAEIPLGAVHRLENPGPADAVIIETQLGDYLGEDDIVRLEDVYGRS
jgi:mannose-1-phosphate guanylyltransferase